MFQRFFHKCKTKRVKYPLPADYDGYYERLGYDIYRPYDRSECSNTFVISPVGINTCDNYILPRLLDYDHKTNAIVYTDKETVSVIKESLPDRNVIELDLTNRPFDYFRCITNKEEAEYFVDRLFETIHVFQEKLCQPYYDFYTKQYEKLILFNAIMDIVSNQKTCEFQSVFNQICQKLFTANGKRNDSITTEALTN